MQTLSSIPSYLGTVAEYISTACVAAYTTAQPYLATLSERIQDVWALTLPYLQGFAAFSSTRFGLSIDLLAASIIPFVLSGCSKNTTASVAMIGTGVLLASASAYLFSGLPLPGFIPASILPTSLI